VKIRQTIPIPSDEVTFSANLKAYAYGANGAWSVSALLIAYQDGNGIQLGSTAIAHRSATCPWTDSGTFHIIGTLANNWQYHSFLLADELANLPDVDAKSVKQIEVLLYISVADC
jgi:hypothetical protein